MGNQVLKQPAHCGSGTDPATGTVAHGPWAGHLPGGILFPEWGSRPGEAHTRVGGNRGPLRVRDSSASSSSAQPQPGEQGPQDPYSDASSLAWVDMGQSHLVLGVTESHGQSTGKVRSQIHASFLPGLQPLVSSALGFLASVKL